MDIQRSEDEINEIVYFIKENKQLSIEELIKEIRKKYKDFSHKEMENILKSRIFSNIKSREVNVNPRERKKYDEFER